MGMPNYNHPGEYVAICNTINWDGHYVKQFTFPQEFSAEGFTAAWYFLNRVDLVACLEGVYPLSLFEGLMKEKTQ